MPKTRGNVMSAHMFVDVDMAGNMVNRRSRKGILIFCNRAPILWHSKRQTTVEISMFGSEFTAMKTGIELVEGLQYKLQMFGSLIEGPTNIFCDNEAVYKSTAVPEATLNSIHIKGDNQWFAPKGRCPLEVLGLVRMRENTSGLLQEGGVHRYEY